MQLIIVQANAHLEHLKRCKIAAILAGSRYNDPVAGVMAIYNFRKDLDHPSLDASPSATS